MSGANGSDPLAELIASAERESGGEGDADTSVPTEAMVVFRAGGRWYAVRAAQVREVVTKERVARVPAMPRHILGVALVHSRLIPVLDVSALLGYALSSVERARLLILEGADSEVSIVAEEARGLIDLPTPSAGARVSFVSGEVSWEDQLVCVLDCHAILDNIGLGGRV